MLNVGQEKISPANPEMKNNHAGPIPSLMTCPTFDIILSIRHES